MYEVPTNRHSVQYYGESTSSRWDDWFYWRGYGWYSRFQRYPNGFASQWDYANANPITASYGADPSDSEYEAEEKEIENARLGVRYAGNVYNATWQDLFADNREDRVNNNYLSMPYNDYKIPYSDNSWAETDYSSPDGALNTSIVNGTEANARLANICQAARDAGIVIYTVAFEAPSGGQSALRNCATSPTHYYNVSGTDIEDAFSAIATDIRSLKLTQ